MSRENTSLQILDHFPFFKSIFERARLKQVLPVAICWPDSDLAMQGAVEGVRLGLIEAILIGDVKRMNQLLGDKGLPASGCRVVASTSPEESVKQAAQLCRRGEARAIMKGSLHTDVFLHGILSKDSGLTGSQRISHVFVIEVPDYGRPILIADAAINIHPSLEEKRSIVQNTIDLAHSLGIKVPRVAILAAVETVESSIASTVDAALLSKMAERGQIKGAIVDGPLSFDTAVSEKAAAVKGLESPVAGHADILIVPDLDSGNMLAKELEYLGDGQIAGVAVGATVPVILTSRADSVASRVFSCAIASIAAGNAFQTSQPAADQRPHSTGFENRRKPHPSV